MSTTVASLLVRIGVSVDGAAEASKELDKVTESAEDVDKEGGSGLRDFGAKAGKAFAAVAAAALAASVAIFKLVDSVTSSNDVIIKQARVTGLSTEAYQRLSFAAKISGTNIKSLSIASKTVALGLSDAATKGTGPFVEGLELVGLRLEDVMDIPFEQQLGIFADAISSLDSESDKLAASQKLLGARAGPQLATLLAEGSEGIRKLGDEAVIVSEQSLETSADFQDSIVRLKDAVGGIVNEIGVELAPVVQEIIDDVKEWTQANGDLIAKDIKNFLRQTIPVIKALVSAVSTIVGVIKDFIDLLGGWKAAMGVAATATIAFKLALAGSLGPIGAVALAISGLVSIVAGLVNQFDDVEESLGDIEQRAVRLRKFRRGKKFAGEEIEGKIFEEEEALRSARVLAKSDDAETQRIGVLSEQASLDRLEKLRDENQAALSEQEKIQRTQDRVKTESAKFEKGVVANRRAAARVREKLGRGKKADRIVQKVALGEISEEEALKKKKRGRGAKKEEEPESDVTLAEALLAVRTGTADPAQLKKVVSQLARKTPSTKSIKPTVAIDFFNFNVVQNFKGADPAKLAAQSAKALRGEFQTQTAKAGQTIPGSVLR